MSNPFTQPLSFAVAFLAPSTWWHDVPHIVAAWQSQGLMTSGVATWLDSAPQEITYDKVMEGITSHETIWPHDPSWLANEARRYTLSTVTFPVVWAHGSDAMMLHLRVGQDESVEVRFDTSYATLYDERSQHDKEENLRRFVDLACALFAPQVMVTGYIDVEASLDRLDEIRRGIHPLPPDRAFYGVRITPMLQDALTSLRARPKDVWSLTSGGLFVRWTEWGRDCFAHACRADGRRR